MYTSILRVLCVFALIFSISAGLQAQIQTTKYNDKLVKSNSIVVKYDDTFAGIKGKSIDPLVLLNDYRDKTPGAVVTTRLKSQNVEEWKISGDIKNTLRELNEIPGVTAFPNYVFYRDELETSSLSFSDKFTVTPHGETSSIGTLYGEELIDGGDFTGDFSPAWSTFIADWIPVTANIAVVNDELSVTDITGINGVDSWYVQANHIFTDEQIDKMVVGGQYSIQFRARTDSAAKDIKFFLGQNGEGFIPAVDFVFTADTNFTYRSVNFILSDKWFSDNGGMKLGFEAGLSDASMFIDDVSMSLVEFPIFDSPDPEIDSSYVISLFSDSFSDVPVDTWRTDWSNATFADDTVQGNAIKSYTNLDFVGIETVSNQIDISEMTHVRFDAWTPNADVFRIKLVDFGLDGAFEGGDDSEHEIEIYDFPKSTWLTIEIPMYVFQNMIGRNNLAQIIFSAVPPGESTLLIDNLYFYDDQSVTNDPLLSLQYGLNNDGTFNPGFSVVGADVDAFAAWEMTTGSDDVIMVVYDDGVDFGHPDLYDNRWVNPGEDLNGNGMIDEDEWNGVDDDGNGYPDDFWGWSAAYDNNSYLNPGSFHGTHVAGILGAQGDNGTGISGVAQDVSIINVMIFNEFGGTDAITIMRGYEYISNLLDTGVEITGINQSWGGGGYLDLESDQQFVTVMTDYALDHAEHAAMWIVSAGNGATNRDELPFYSYPNNIQSPNIITVASSDDADNLSGFSDYGYFTVDVAAPGTNILSTLPPSTTGQEYGFLSGTSMAAPHVSGILALAKSMYPDEDGFALASRLFAGDEANENFAGVIGSPGRVNAMGTLDPKSVGNDADIASGAETQFHRTFVDGIAYETTGFVNNTEGDVTVTGMTISGDNADNFFLLDDELPTVGAGESYGILVGFDNDNLNGDLVAQITFETTGGTIIIGLIGHEQGFGAPFLESEYVNFGSVPYGTELSTSFTINNDGNADLLYDLQQSLFFYDLEFSEFIESMNRFEPSISTVEKGVPQDDVEFLNEFTTRVMLDRGDRMLPKIKYQEGMHPRRELDGPEEVWFDDLNDADAVESNWEVLDYGLSGDNWDLHDINNDSLNNVFLFGDFEFGYSNNSTTVAIPPAFDFSELEEGKGPAYLVFDTDVQLEFGYDDFYVNVISNGSRLATIAGTFDGSIPNFGGYNRVWIDISQFAGNDDVEFWFISNTDDSYVAGFGAIFDNISVIVDDQPFFTSTSGGVIAPGESENIDITIRTELLPPGDFVLFTDVFTNGFISYYGGGALFHTAEFSARNVALEINPMEQWLGEVPADEPIEFGFDANNVGTVGVDYFADVFIVWEQPDDFMDASFVAAKEEALARFETSDKDDGEAIDLVEHRNMVLENATKRSDVSAEVRSSERPRMTPSRESLDLYFEDFESGEFTDGWDIYDESFGLGNVFEVENFGSEENPSHMLDVGGLSENGWFIRNDTYTLAFSPTFDLSEVPLNEDTFMEFTYSFLLEPGWDFASVWLGVETEFGIQLIYGGSSDDIFFNNGGLYRSGFNISAFNGEETVFMAFLVETDGSVQSAWASWDDLDVYTSEKLIYIDPNVGTIDSAGTQSFNVTVNTPWLSPGNYAAISVIDFYNDELFIGRNAQQYTSFEIPNMAPVAEDDYFAVITDEVISMDAIIGAMLSNDFDPEGSMLYLYDVEDPIFGDMKYTFDGWVYVAPEEGDKEDYFRYIITDGQKMDTATVYMSIGDNPHFPVGSDKQFVFLEDESLTMSTVGMAAGVGFWENVMVWAAPHNEGVFIDAGEELHSITFSAEENLFGQFSATFYVGTDDGSAWDSMEVSIVVIPVNDAPTAEFSVEVDGSQINLTDASNDDLDLTSGGIVKWEWDFGDGNISEDRNPTHTYSEIGDYSVTLKVTDNGGLSNIVAQSVPINVSNEDLEGIPTEFSIDQNYPNPFNPSTVINYSVPEASKVSIVIYDMLGQKVADLVNSEQSVGKYSVTFDASGLSSGVYIYQLRAGTFSQTKKMLLIK